MPRKKLIEGNTRKNEYITEHTDYKENSDRLEHHGPVSGVPKHPIFSIIKHYPPEWAQQ